MTTPVNVVSGFLGSGKTTLIARLLRDPQLANTAVIINEFGEVGLDHAWSSRFVVTIESFSLTVIKGRALFDTGCTSIASTTRCTTRRAAR
jgi:G3E family GTPase